jgi:hypothetical protein
MLIDDVLMDPINTTGHNRCHVFFFLASDPTHFFFLASDPTQISSSRSPAVAAFAVPPQPPPFSASAPFNPARLPPTQSMLAIQISDGLIQIVGGVITVF